MTDTRAVAAVVLAALIGSFIADTLTRSVAGVQKYPCRPNIRVNV
jgi:hypothetical protein